MARQTEDISWPATSPSLIASDVFLWHCLKSTVYYKSSSNKEFKKIKEITTNGGCGTK
jgi:hypothetical protein